MNVLIVEDEMMAQANLARALTQHFPDVRIVGTTGSVRETVLWLRTPGNSADVIFMDVELSDGDCFEIFRQADVTARVIMTTAYDNYAVRAFEVNSIDYLLKPIDLAALRRAVERCLRTGGGSIGSAAPNVRWMFPPKNNGSDLRLQIRAVVPCRAFCVAAAAM